jgi:hypothetical protein
MPTAGKIRQNFGDKFAKHIVSVDHNVLDKFDREFSFHAVCHPDVGEDGKISIPSEIEEYISDISDNYEVVTVGHYVHLHIGIDDDVLGIDRKEQAEVKTENR